MRDALVYSTAAYGPFADGFARALGAQRGRIEREIFPDGERYSRLVDDPDLRDAVLVGGTIGEADTTEIFDLGCAIVGEGARSLTLVIPYFGYSTMERATRPGEVVTAKTRARLLSAIPPAHSGTAALLLDLHAEGIPYYFGDALTARHVSARPLIVQAIRGLFQTAAPSGEDGDLVVGSCDAGRAKWVQEIANDVDAPVAFVYKRRVTGGETRITGVNADVAGRTVALYDDMIRTGGTVIQAARAYREAGAGRVVAFATHFLPAEGAVGAMRASGDIERIVCTDSHPKALGHPPEFVTVLSVAPLLADAALKEGC